jgi:hypothetical protein
LRVFVINNITYTQIAKNGGLAGRSPSGGMPWKKRMLFRRRGWTGGGWQKAIQFWMVLPSAIQNIIFL